MLTQFSFSNFKSYRDDTVFSFQAEAIPEFRDSLLDTDSASPLLPVSVVYGPNAGGKTNLLQALSALIFTVVKPVMELGKNRVHGIIQQDVSVHPFLLDSDSKNRPSEFEIYFRTSGNEFRYYIAILDSNIVSEHLYWRTIGGKKTGTVFKREGSSIELGASIGNGNINKDVNPKMPYLSFLAINYNIPLIVQAESWFESCITKSYAVPDNSLSGIPSDPERKNLILKALNDLGIDVTDYQLNSDGNRLYTKRIIDGEPHTLSFDEESDGTRKLLSVLPLLITALKEGRLAVIDELDAKLHPKLLRYIICLFKNTHINRNGAQLLFTSHDISTMKNTVFRRDEIWFSALDQEHTSRIYSLYDIRKEDDTHVNNTAAYDKQYLEGRYGADPYLRNMLDGSVWK
ncbi:MAG: ATP-binding protein [Clostridia bacterium]|nr:ATP-binding protein [Clostridia bacterium]